MEEHGVEAFADGTEGFDVIASSCAFIRWEADPGSGSTVGEEGDAPREHGWAGAAVEGEVFKRRSITKDGVDRGSETVVLVEQIAGCYKLVGGK